jgi:hypothetical protein
LEQQKSFMVHDLDATRLSFNLVDQQTMPLMVSTMPLMVNPNPVQNAAMLCLPLVAWLMIQLMVNTIPLTATWWHVQPS